MNGKNLIEDIGLRKPAHPTEVELAALPKKEYKPWHKPRKQYIRKEQWIKHITDHLVSELDLTERSFRYFSFPGQDMLDIRVLAKYCEEKSINLRCLGIDESISIAGQQQQIETNISRSEISKVIKEGSVITPDPFISLANEQSQGYNYFKSHGPFDLINLDFCDSIFSKDRIENHNALQNICNYQIQKRKEPWLLFITTRADLKSINPLDLDHYWYNINTNINDFDHFHDELYKVINNLKFTNESELVISSIKKLTADSFARLFAIGIGKWLLKLMMNGEPFWPVEMLDSCWYRVEASNKPNMLSLSFKFCPHPEHKKDPSGLAKPVASNPPDERLYALGILNKSGAIQDVDATIFQNKQLLDKMIEESSDLLKTARYPVDAYDAWAKKKLVRF